MKQIVVLSGKGGTGKTSVSASLIHLCAKSARSGVPVFVDADVDAANLGLLIKPDSSTSFNFQGGSLAEIDPLTCINCKACVDVCRYDAILTDPSGKDAQWVDPIACDGCAACVYACPQNSIQMVQQQEGVWFQSSTPFGQFFHAELFPGRENSGKLVTLIKQQARLFAEENNTNVVIIDGPPGIGCPVISACAGTDYGLIITEPGLSGLHDLMRVNATLKHFKIPTMLCINKADIDPDSTKNIIKYANENQIDFLGEIPYDDSVIRAVTMGLPVTQAFPESIAAHALEDIWEKLESKSKSGEPYDK